MTYIPLVGDRIYPEEIENDSWYSTVDAINVKTADDYLAKEKTLQESGGADSIINATAIDEKLEAGASAQVGEGDPVVETEANPQFAYGAENTVPAGTLLRIAYEIRTLEPFSEKIDIINGEAFALRKMLADGFNANDNVSLVGIALFGPNPLTRNLVFLDIRVNETIRIENVFPASMQLQRDTGTRFGFLEAPADFKPVELRRIGVSPQPNGFGAYPVSGILQQSQEVVNAVTNAAASSAEFTGNAVGNFFGGAINPRLLALVFGMALLGGIGYLAYREAT